MKTIGRFFLFFLLFAMPMRFLAQVSEVDTISTAKDSVLQLSSTDMLPGLAADYYKMGMESFNRSFEYDLLNKKKMLNWTSLYISIFGVVTSLSAIIPVIPVLIDWPVWAMCTYVLGSMAVILTPSFYLLFHFKKLADAIDVSTLAQLPINNKVSLDMVCYSYRQMPAPNNHTLGVGITLKF